jgi:hypothetical protein
MAAKKKTAGGKLGLALLGTVAETITAVASPVSTIAEATAPLVKIGADALSGKIEENKKLIEIPQVVFSEGYIKLDEAKREMEAAGLDFRELAARENAAYKDCSDFDIVGTNYKDRQKVPPGTRVVLYYVTAEVIEKSKRLFEGAERLNAEKKERGQQMLNDALENTKRGFLGAADSAKKGFGKLLNKQK